MRHYLRAVLFGAVIATAPVVGGCDESAATPAPPQASPAALTFENNVRPIFEQKCIACHGCYDAPCQLKLETLEGLDRGAAKTPVYKQRAEAAAPTRLFVDAQSTADWRDKGFFSVIDSTTGMEQGLLYRMLVLGKSHSFEPDQPLPDDVALGIGRENVCPLPAQMDEYIKNHPLEGMPLGTPPLTDQELSTIEDWLNQGATLGDSGITLSKGEQRHIRAWETWLNRTDKRQQLVARWVFEHLFLAHLYFDDGSGERPAHFFTLERSLTPPGTPVKPVATVRPNDPPGEHFWYRLRPVRGAIVHKTHITYALTEAKRARIETLFFAEPWSLDELPGYGEDERANPFTTFAALPAKARYQIMLDDAEYFVRTFIRGPVCRGQIATDVIRDQFWAVFQDPDHDLYLTDSDYRAEVSGLLGLPGQEGSLLKLGPQWIKYTHERNQYLRRRHQIYASQEPEGPGWESLWAGDGDNSNALLTILRHRDNASVRQGLIGDYPLTTWVMDYPLFERSYYNLVVNFDVFGSVSHQAQTRLYFDLIRNGAEQNTLRYLPAKARKKVLDSWYQKTGKLKLFVSYASVDTRTPTSIGYQSTTPMNEFNAGLLTHFQHLNARPDPINRCAGEHCYRDHVSALEKQADQAFSRIASMTAARLPVIHHLPEVSLIQVRGDDGELAIYTLFRNRAHSNVAFLLGESLRYQPEKDTITIYPGVLASYPNFMFRVDGGQLDAFVTAMAAAQDDDDFNDLVARFGIRRTTADFWRYFHAPTRYLDQHEPIQSGALDLNRYENL
ncbi:fatty acid cis/trans isomerase [Alloalcanivorax mobilis]|uniref:fatty acid cis/trans isomerase n=1 Tax=Alloalcanivorax mobilis TaxID=2019569 RepID=UPI000C791645|nr:fatty acid cis/trans isomerase [Alloalcanivorax mobilis]